MKLIGKVAFASLLAIAMAGTVVQVQAQDSPAKEKKEPAKAEKKQGGLPFRGKVSAVDKDAKTVTVGARTFQITSETKIIKANKPATLEDGVVGEEIGGSYRKGDDGKLTAAMIRFGPKPEGEGARKKKEK